MKTIIATLIAAALAVCATVWPPAATADTVPTIEPSPTVAAETAPAEQQAEEPATQHEQSIPELIAEPAPPAITAEPKPTPALHPQAIITEEKEITSLFVSDEPIIEEHFTPQSLAEEPVIVEYTNTGADIIIEHAKTGYEEEPPTEPPVVEPEAPIQTADINTAIAVAEAYAIEIYNVVIDSSLDFNNSAYRFPAAVPLTVDQDTLNAKAIDITNYTFEQMMRRNDATIEKMREAGIHCRIYAEQTDHDILIYCLYC